MWDNRMTVMGNAVADAALFAHPDGNVSLRLRLASTTSYYDADKQEYVDRATEFVTVRARNQLARNVAASVRKGDRVFVSGRWGTAQWNRENGTPEHDTIVFAEAVGHDLAFGTTRYVRARRRPEEEPEVDFRSGEIVSQRDPSTVVPDDAAELLEPAGAARSASSGEETEEAPF
ncbi:single-stranded DNA-binding protein [Brachybacterium huguangmaarense]